MHQLCRIQWLGHRKTKVLWHFSYLKLILKNNCHLPLWYVYSHPDHFLLELVFVIAECAFKEEHGSTVCMMLQQQNRDAGYDFLRFLYSE